MRHKRIHKFLVLVLTVVFCLMLSMTIMYAPIAAAGPGDYTFDPGDDWTLVWHDEFDGNDQNGQPSGNLNEYGVNLNNWGVLKGSNDSWEGLGQYYHPSQAQVNGGQLTIALENKLVTSISSRARWYTAQLISSPLAESYDNRLDFNLPKDGLSRTYGRYEARIQLPQYKGLLQSFWMMPTHGVYGGWTGSGEIDIVEAGDDGSISGTIHFGGPWPGNKYLTGNYCFPDSETANRFHVYAVEWDPDEIRWYCDDVLYHTETSDKWYTTTAPNNPLAPFDRDFHMILGIDNMMWSGGWGMPSPTGPAQMVVDYVRVYEKASPAPDPYEFDPGDNWTLAWHDEFDGVNHNGGTYNPTAGGVDKSNWGFESGYGGNWGNAAVDLLGEMQNYIPEMAAVSDGMLHMHAQPKSGSGYTDLIPNGGSWYSAKLLTSPGTKNYRSYDITNPRSNSAPATGYAGTYGRVEARIKLPGGTGCWPAFWMMPQDAVYGGWAASGEIDIMENQSGHVTDVMGTIHCGGAWPANTYLTANFSFPDGEDVTQFHVYAVEWEEAQMRWYVDGVCYQTRDSTEWSTNAAPGNPLAPFDQDFFIVLNLGIGGALGGGMATPGTPVDMVVDYVRVYEKASPAPEPYEFNPGDDWTLAWHDEFDGVNHNGGTYDPTAGGVDKSNWGFESGGGSMFGWYSGIEAPQNYIPEMATVSDGVLTMHAQPKSGSGFTDLVTVGGSNWYSAKLITSPGTKNYKTQDLTSPRSNGAPATGYAGTYGRIEARLKLPNAYGTWPAFWMMPQDNVYGGWAASGEIDIMEQASGEDTIGGTIHMNAWPGNFYRTKSYSFPAGESSNGWHVDAIQWTEGRIEWYVDDQMFHWEEVNSGNATTGTGGWRNNQTSATNPNAPFDQDFYIILNLGIGGALGGGGIRPSGPVDMYVDYVRVYERAASPTSPALTGTINSYNPNTPATVRLLRDGVEKYKTDTETQPGSGPAEQPFTFSNIAPGIYTMVVTKPGHASYTVQNITVGDEGITTLSRAADQAITLPCGDISGDGMINDSDLAVLWLASNYNKSANGMGVDKLCDLNGDGMVNDGDLAILWLAANYNMGAILIP